MTDPENSYIAVVSDCSGSMSAIKSDAEGAINAFIEEQKKAPGRATFTLVEFDSVVRVVHENVDLQSVGPYELRPGGTTALLDAWGQTIDRVGNYLSGLSEDQRPGHVIIVIATDGYENASREYTRDQVREKTQHQREVYKWEFIFLAANQDAVETGVDYGVPAQAAVTYGANPVGTRNAYAAVSQAVVGVRSGQSKGVVFTDEQRRAAQGQDT